MSVPLILEVKFGDDTFVTLLLNMLFDNFVTLLLNMLFSLISTNLLVLELLLGNSKNKMKKADWKPSTKLMYRSSHLRQKKNINNIIVMCFLLTLNKFNGFQANVPFLTTGKVDFQVVSYNSNFNPF